MLYKNFNQIIFIDYNIIDKCNSTDGSIKYIENFDDKENKILLLKDFNPDKITKFNGYSFIDKQKMFAYASLYINDKTDIVWATDMDEFFNEELINKVENIYKNNNDIINIHLEHKIFVYNQYNYYNKLINVPSRITKHKKKFIYGHCNFDTYGKTFKMKDEFIYHYAFVGYKRCEFKFNKIYKNNNNLWLHNYLVALKSNKKYIELPHPNKTLKNKTIKYNLEHPKYIDLEEMVNKLNLLD